MTTIVIILFKTTRRVVNIWFDLALHEHIL